MRLRFAARGAGVLTLLMAAVLSAPVPSRAAGWKAGVATAVITPEEPVWMAGYGGRTEPSQGKIHDLYVKALAVEDSHGARAVIVTGDIIGYTYEFTDAVSREIGRRFGLPRSALFFNASHTHCGPEIRPSKGDFLEIPAEYKAKIEQCDNWLRVRYIKVISDALAAMKPAELSFSSAVPVPFAVSRRFPTDKGIVYRSTPSSYYTGGSRDDVVPVLRVADPGGAVRAIVFGYACHPITLNIDYFCGDYPGYAQRYVEEAYPGAVAMFVQGCSGELVPDARFQLEYAMGHGRVLADAVKKALGDTLKPLSGPLSVGYDEVPLQFKPVPERAVLEEQAKSAGGSYRLKARFLLDRLNRNEPIQTTVSCPLQVLKFGKGRVVQLTTPLTEAVAADREQALGYLRPLCRVWSAGGKWPPKLLVNLTEASPRGPLCVHLVNYDFRYDDKYALKSIEPAGPVRLEVIGARRGRLLTPEGEEKLLRVTDGRLEVPPVRVYGVVVLEK